MKIDHTALKKADEQYNLRRILSEEIIVKTADDWWDGALSGRCEWKGSEYYFECFDQLDEETDSDRWPRKYILLKLNTEQETEIGRLYALFKGSAHNEASRAEYISALKSAPIQTIEPGQIVGWFDSDKLQYNVPDLT